MVKFDAIINELSMSTRLIIVSNSGLEFLTRSPIYEMVNYSINYITLKYTLISMCVYICRILKSFIYI